MRVAHGLVDLAVLEPLDGEPAGADARERMAGEGAHGHLPVLVAVGAHRAQARGRRAEGRVAVRRVGRPRRDGGADEHTGDGDDRGDAGPARQPERAQAHALLGLDAAGAQLNGGRDEHEDEEDQEDERALRLPTGQAPGEPAHARGQAAGDRARDARLDDEGRAAQLAPAGREEHQDDEAAEQRGERSAGEAQVGACQQRHRGRSAERAHATGARAVARQPRAQHDADRGQAPLRVPVGERLLQAPAGVGRVGLVDDPGKQAARQAVADDHERPRHDRRLDGAERVARAPGAGGGRERDEVEQDALGVGPGAPRQRRPRVRPRDPAREQRQPAERRPAGAAARQGPRLHDGADRQQHAGGDQGGEAGPVEEAAGRERQRKRGDEQRRPVGTQEDRHAARQRTLRCRCVDAPSPSA